MSNQDKVQDFIDNVMMDVSDSEFDYDLSDIELDSLTIRHGRVDDFDLSGQPIVEEYDFVYCNASTLESKLLELIEGTTPEMGHIYDAVAEVLGNKLVVESVNGTPTQMSTSAIARELTIAINKGEE